MKIAFDPAKRDWTLRERGLDFSEASLVFEGTTTDDPDDRRDYGELRMITGRPSARAHGRHRLDATRRGPAWLLHEESQ